MGSSGLKILVAMALLVALAGCGTTIDKQSAPTTLDDVPRITPREVKELIDGDEELVIVDTRSLEQYNAGHIAGAVSLPVSEIAARHEELPKDRLIVLYCT